MKTWHLRRGRNMPRIDFGWCFFKNVEELLLSMFLRVQVRACACSSVLSYAGMFLRLYICGNGSTYVGSCLCAWALTCVCETLGRSPTLLIFTHFSIVSPLCAILTPFFVILASEHHCIILFIFILASKHHIPKFHLKRESNVIFLFVVIIPLC